jgi:N-methylhydantoinase A/oxoprolinase/acetone carboxylase beta subunit
LGLTAQEADGDPVRPMAGAAMVRAARDNATAEATGAAAALAQSGTGMLFDPETGRSAPVAAHLRAGLRPGTTVPGPALVAEEQTTVVVPRGFAARVLQDGHLLVERLREES